MIGLTIRTDAMRRSLETYARKLHDVAQKALVDATEAAQASAKTTIHATTTRRTGDAEDNWGSTWLGPYKRRLKSFSGHAGFIESGTHGHFIPGSFMPARGGKTLAFMWHGKLTFRRWVYHPGTKARPFLDTANASGQMAMKASAQIGLDRIAREF